MKVVVPFIISFFLIVFSNQALWAQSQSELNIRLLEAAKNNSSESVKYWLDKGAYINYADENGFGVLHQSIAKYNNDLCLFLISKGAYVNGIGVNYQPPILTAAINGNLRACYYLFSNGANLNKKNKENKTAFEIALEKGYRRVARFLDNPSTYSENPTFWELFKQSLSYSEKKDYKSAISFIKLAKESAENELSFSHFSKKTILMYLADYYTKCDSLEEAVSVYNIGVLPLEERLSGKISSEYAQSLMNLAEIYKAQEKYSKAEVVTIQALNIRKDILGEHNTDYVISLHNLASLYFRQGKIKECEDMYLRIVEINEDSIRLFDHNYASTLNNLATFYLDIDDYDKSLKYQFQALELIKSIYGMNNTTYALYLNNLASLYFKFGILDKAEECINEAIQIQLKIDGDSNQNILTFINNLAEICELKGLFKEAESHFIKLIEIQNKLGLKENAFYATSLNNLGCLYLKMGLYKNAEKFLIQAVEIRRKVFGEKNSDYAIAISNLALVYLNTNRLNEAEEKLRISIQIMKDNYGDSSSQFAKALNNIGSLLFELGQLDKAKEIQSEILRIIEICYSQNHPAFIFSLCEIANIDFANNNFESSEFYYQKALKITNGFNRIFYPNIIGDQINLAEIYRYQGNILRSYEFCLESANNIRYEIMENFQFLSSPERLVHYQENSIYYSEFHSISFDLLNKKKDFSTFALNNELFFNSLLLNTTREIQQSILNSKDTVLVSTFDEFKSLRQQINYLQQQPQEKQKGLPELEEKANQLDKQLTKASQAYQQNKENLNIQWQDVQKGLKVGEVAIQFISFPYYNRTWTDSILYCALVVKPGMEYPALIPLFEQKQLDSLLVKSYSSPDILYASRGTKLSYNYLSTLIAQSGNELYNLIWKPIEKELNGVKRVYYSPSGTLHQIAFAALPVDSTQVLSDKFDLYQLSSTRQLAISEWKNQHDSITSASLFGGITFDMDERELSKFKKDSTEYEFLFSRSFTPDSSQRSTSFNFLAGSNEEVKTIASLLKEKSIPVFLNSGLNGDEATFKNLSNQDVNVLHIATHGFFFPFEREKPTDSDRFQFSGEQKFRYVPNPLLRSGLILSGGNSTWKGKIIPGSEDGILTAQEISEMNLSNTDLVVLSACETGLGDINNSEGVFGLQRAFKLAGVNTIIMSLWKVPDQQTSMLMQSFYKHWLNGMSKHNAFREAQKEVRQVYPRAYYWAGFLMVD